MRVQFGVVISGVADEFPCPFREALHDAREQVIIHCAGSHNAHSSVSRKHTCIGDGVSEPSA